MNASLRWLRAIAPEIDNDARKIADRLAMYGAPVDEIVDVGGALGDIRIGHVLEVRRHPNADRLSLCRVDAGTDEPLDVVCGAPNVRAGGFYPFAPVGATLPDGMTIRKAKIRGETSNGMLCSARELALGRDHEGILELHGTFQPGASFIHAVGLDDVRIVIDVTPNRPDLLSHWGLARELAPGGEHSLTLAPLPGTDGRAADFAFVRGTPRAQAAGVSIATDDPVACPRYIGVVVRNVRIAPSPEWLAARLRAIGARPINNVVDATNWVLFELGQPLHAFDLDAVGPHIVVRAARAGETLVTLDDVTRKLTPDVLLITDGSRPVALAGLMGGAETEVREGTRNLLLECALFDPQWIRRGRRRLDMSTDASYRFERGVDPDGMERAVRRAVDIILATAGGEVDAVAACVDAGVPAIPPVRVRAARVERVLGVPIEPRRIAQHLAVIGFDAVGDETDATLYAVPGHRRYDVSREEDLIEEVARRVGYDAFPDEVRPFRASVVPDDPVAALEDRVRTLLVARGFLEARSASLGPESEGDVPLLLPLSATESHLRRALLPGLLRRLEANFNRGARDVRLFEVGTVFAPGKDGRPLEATHFAAVLTGTRAPAHWTGAEPPFDLWDTRGLMEEAATLLGARLETQSATGPFVTGESFAVAYHDDIVGGGGRVRDESLDAPAWAGDVYGFEITLTDAMTESGQHVFRALPTQPPADRDLALVVGDAWSAAAIETTIRTAAGSLLESVAPFDVYTGEGVPAGTRSIAFRLRFRAPDRTLTDAEVDGILERILHRLQEEHDVERR